MEKYNLDSPQEDGCKSASLPNPEKQSRLLCDSDPTNKFVYTRARALSVAPHRLSITGHEDMLFVNTRAIFIKKAEAVKKHLGQPPRFSFNSTSWDQAPQLSSSGTAFQNSATAPGIACLAEC
ncbi:hypothetical protein SRHO_G00039410 [Serrasalmus rhombeus]